MSHKAQSVCRYTFCSLNQNKPDSRCCVIFNNVDGQVIPLLMVSGDVGQNFRIDEH